MFRKFTCQHSTRISKGPSGWLPFSRVVFRTASSDGKPWRERNKLNSSPFQFPFGSSRWRFMVTGQRQRPGCPMPRDTFLAPCASGKGWEGCCWRGPIHSTLGAGGVPNQGFLIPFLGGGLSSASVLKCCQWQCLQGLTSHFTFSRSHI